MSSFAVAVEWDGHTVSGSMGNQRLSLADQAPGPHTLKLYRMFGRRELYAGTIEVPAEGILRVQWTGEEAVVTRVEDLDLEAQPDEPAAGEDTERSGGGEAGAPAAAPIDEEAESGTVAGGPARDAVPAAPPAAGPVAAPSDAALAAAPFATLQAPPGFGVAIFLVPEGETATAHVGGAYSVRILEQGWAPLFLPPGQHRVKLRDGADTRDLFEGELSIDEGARLVLFFGEQTPPSLHYLP
ncbi:MAG: hypothetical protein JXX28_03945 [Deltaproteobacteria bacterium]|nr:hypothetical protein [Deltaproteobacteria bacterium]